MRIGCVGEGHELLGLMSVLGVYNHDYHLIADHRAWPASSKSQPSRLLSVKRLFDYSQSLNLDLIIVSPAYESVADLTLPVLKIFEQLIKTYVAPNSLVNKRGLLGEDEFELQEVQSYVRTCLSGYIPAFKQENNKHYCASPKITVHEVPQMKYHILTYGKRDWMMRKSWKYDLRCMKDAAVDTIIPANWSLLHREGIIRHHLNRKKVNIIGKKQIQEVFSKETEERQDQYSISIHTTDQEGFEKTFLVHKKRRWMLERGKQYSIDWKTF